MTVRVQHLLLAGTLVVSACKEDAGAPERAENTARQRNVAFFLANPDEHEAVKRRCKNDPGALRNTTDCVNADQAQKQIFVWGRDEALRRSQEGS